MGPMRLFVAVDIDDRTRRQLAAAQDALRQMLDGARVPPRVTWVNPRIAHVTVRFIGEVPEETTLALQSALSGLSFAPFEVTWGRLGILAGRRDPRVIWVGLGSGLDAFRDLAHALDARIDPVIGARTSRPFAPHLTVGRVRARGRGVDWARTLETVPFPATAMRIARVTLFQSHLASGGPTYTALSSHG